MSYKRNQIEEAIARIFAPNCEKPPSELRTRIKRLLDLDRSIGRKLRSKDAEEANFGFFSEEAPGTGADILFSEYDRFNYAPRPSRSRKAARADSQARSGKPFDQQAIRAGALEGAIAVNNTDPVFLTLASKAQHAANEGQTAPLSKSLVDDLGSRVF
jgi:hypothetical protein